MYKSKYISLNLPSIPFIPGICSLKWLRRTRMTLHLWLLHLTLLAPTVLYRLQFLTSNKINKSCQTTNYIQIRWTCLDEICFKSKTIWKFCIMKFSNKIDCISSTQLYYQLAIRWLWWWAVEPIEWHKNHFNICCKICLFMPLDPKR